MSLSHKCVESKISAKIQIYTLARPPIYLYSIFVILQFEISSLMNWIFSLISNLIPVQTGELQKSNADR